MPVVDVDRQEQAVVEWARDCAQDPLRFVEEGYPWGEPGPLELETGPDSWQRDFLLWLGDEVRARAFDGITPVMPVRRATASGHGIGKSTLVAWLVDWIMSTREDAKGTITANTSTQLETKTWAAIQRWTNLCISGHWFEVHAERMYHRDHKVSWFCSPITCREENSEAFAGQQNRNSTSFYIFDEASAVPDKIYEVAEGGLAVGEPMMFTFGNPTRRSGKFYEECFGDGRNRWSPLSIDSRECKFRNDTLIQEYLEDYGEDSDFFRVRVRGLPPSASDAQFIDSGRVYGAQRRVAAVLRDEPLVAGVDVSGGGSAWTVCRFRQGLDGRAKVPIRLTGEQSRDRNLVTAKLAEALRTNPIAAMFIDTAFGAPIVERLHWLGFKQVHEVNFGGPSANQYQANMRAYMWNKLKDWLEHGAIDPKDTRLESDLCAPGFHLNHKDQLVLESKESMQKRGVASPDDGDALALTFAMPIGPVGVIRQPSPRPLSVWS